MPKFREEYENTNDAILFEHAPASLYIASPLGQNTLVTNGANNILDFYYEVFSHEGDWEFEIRACIDTSPGVYCDPGSNKVTFSFVTIEAPQPDTEVEPEEDPDVVPEKDEEEA